MDDRRELEETSDADGNFQSSKFVYFPRKTSNLSKFISAARKNFKKAHAMDLRYNCCIDKALSYHNPTLPVCMDGENLIPGRFKKMHEYQHISNPF